MLSRRTLKLYWREIKAIEHIEQSKNMRRINNMNYDITIGKTTEEFYRMCAEEIVSVIRNKPNAVIGLSTGRTTGGIHQAMVDIYHENPYDVSKVTIFGLDEVTGVSTEYFGSCYYMLLHECVLPLHIPMENYLMLPTHSENWNIDCKKFCDELERRGGIDLQVLGIGENGHIGFNQPGTPFSQRCFKGSVHDYLEKRIREETNTPEGIELAGVTLGIADVMYSKRILLCANTESKREIMRATLYGEITEEIPASCLQKHPNLRIICDEAASCEEMLTK